MDDLIDRLEKATGPDRELFLEIAWRSFTYDSCPWRQFVRFIMAEAWENAAMLLIPAACNAMITIRKGGKSTARVGTLQTKLHGEIGEHSSPAIALCIAALKALASQSSPLSPPAPPHSNSERSHVENAEGSQS